MCGVKIAAAGPAAPEARRSTLHDGRPDFAQIGTHNRVMANPQVPRQALVDAIAVLNAQRAMLSDAVVDAALGPLREKLAALDAAAAAPAPAAERRLRQVSVMFLDIVGSTQLSQHLDPEDIQLVVDGALAAFTTIVQAHGGEVLQYAGDNLLAAFGANGAREDDAERAVRCGLALLQEAARRGAAVLLAHGRAGFNARVGIHTGSVLRGGGVDDDNSLRGLAVNIAARMEQASAPGRLRISQDTWAQVRGLFDAEAQPAITVKGHDAPIASWLVQGAKPRAFVLQSRGIEGLETPLVGRAAELAVLSDALESVFATRQPRMLTLVADAGLGKSRLLHEFQHRLATHASSWWLLLARSQPSGALQPYGLLRDLLARRLDIADSDSADVARAKFVQGLAPWLCEPGDPAPEWLGHLIGLDFSASAAVQRLGSDARLLRERGLSVLRLWFSRLTASDGSPVVLLLDDLHWSDDASLDALVWLLKDAQTPLLALLCARPGLLERRPDWGSDLPSHQQLTLLPLNDSQRSELTQSLLQRLSPVPPLLNALVQRQAEGNPFYAEELVKMLLDQQVIESLNGEWIFHADRLLPDRLPTTLTGVLQARLDSLSGPERHALQMASVIGPVFWDAALGALDSSSPLALPALQRKAMVQLRPASAFEGTSEESFHHHLLHQVSYETVLKSDRRVAHARAAAWLTERLGERSDEYLAITAEHHERAGAHALAADWFERAATMAGKRHATRTVLQYLDRAEAQALLAPESWPPERRMKLLHSRALSCDTLALREQQTQATDALLALAEAQDDRAWIARALTQKSLLADRLGQSDVAEALARRGAVAAEAADLASQAALCHGNLAWQTMQRNALDKAREHLDAATPWALLARERMVDTWDAIYEVQLLLIRADLHQKEFDEAAAGVALGQALTLALDVREPRLAGSCRLYSAHWALNRAEPQLASPHIEALARLAAEYGFAMHAACAQVLQAEVHLLAREWDLAAQTAAAATAAFRAIRATPMMAQCMDVEAEALWRGGHLAQAAQAFRDVASVWCDAGQDANARAARLRAADAVSGVPDQADSALQAVRAELPALALQDALVSVKFGLAARVAAWRVLQRAGDPAAAVQLEMAAADLDRRLQSFAAADLRERVRSAMPWHHDVVEAVASARAQGLALGSL